jgi:hypothetical protein
MSDEASESHISDDKEHNLESSEKKDIPAKVNFFYLFIYLFYLFYLFFKGG